MDPFIGEIRALAFTFAPVDWATCDGQTLPIQQNAALFSIIGNRFGGNGQTNFMLPNLMGRVTMGCGSGPGLTHRELGDTIGSSTVSLGGNDFPPHTHPFNVVAGTTTADKTTAANSLLGVPPAAGRPPVATRVYQSAPPTNPVALQGDAIAPAGTAQSAVDHVNAQPYLPILMCIAINGIYPARP